MREYQDDKVDIIHKYNADEVSLSTTPTEREPKRAKQARSFLEKHPTHPTARGHTRRVTSSNTESCPRRSADPRPHAAFLVSWEYGLLGEWEQEREKAWTPRVSYWAGSGARSVSRLERFPSFASRVLFFSLPKMSFLSPQARINETAVDMAMEGDDNEDIGIDFDEI